MAATFAKHYNAMLNWRPNLIGQFALSMLLSLLPLSIVVIVFLNALNKQLATTQQIVSNHYQLTKSFANLKQDLNSLERATRQNWVLKSDALNTLIVDKWQSSVQSINELKHINANPDYINQWTQLLTILQTAQHQLVEKKQQKAELFLPISESITELTVWLKNKNEAQITHNLSLIHI